MNLLSQVLPVWIQLLDHAQAWVDKHKGAQSIPALLYKNVAEAFLYRFEKHYQPCLPAAYLLDPIGFVKKPSGCMAPPLCKLSDKMIDDAVMEISRLSGIPKDEVEFEMGRYEFSTG